MKNKPEAITVIEAAYLKHAGAMIDVKVVIRAVDGFPVIYIRDTEYRSFRSALLCLRHITESEVVSTEDRP